MKKVVAAKLYEKCVQQETTTMNSKPFTEYEWDIETHDANGDVVDHFFADKLSDFNSKDLAAAMWDGRLFLMRTLYDTDDSLLERWYAPWCVSEPMETGDAHFKFQDRPVPARFAKELRKAQATITI